MARQIEIEKERRGKSWIGKLSANDRDWLENTFEYKTFASLLQKGYEPILVVFGDEKTDAWYTSTKQTELAIKAIKQLRTNDVQRASSLHAEPREYVWNDSVILPPADWKEREHLTRDDIFIDRTAVTIFAKKEAIK